MLCDGVLYQRLKSIIHFGVGKGDCPPALMRGSKNIDESLFLHIGISRLRKDGVIIADVAIVDPVQSQVTMITSIRLASETRTIYEAFKTKMKACPEVAQCYTVSGEADFIIVAHFPDLPSYEAWIDAYILSDDSVQRSETNIVYSRVKFETAVSI